ncbi:MAG: stage II sporulation protein P [Coprococcus sp.]
MAKSKIKRKLNYLVIWIAIIFALWFVKCEKNLWHIFQQMLYKLIYAVPSDEYGNYVIKEDEYYGEYAETYEDELYAEGKMWDKKVYDYCLAECAENLQYVDEETDKEKLGNAEQIKSADSIIKNEKKGGEEETDKTKNSETQDKYIAAMASCTSYKQEILSDYDLLKASYYIVDSSTNILPEELNGVKLTEVDLTIDTDSEDYKILIYHTHSTEAFADSESGKRSDTVVGMGDYLAELLEEQYGVKVYHDDSAYDIVNGTLDRSAAYDYAREGVIEILDKYPSIEVVIDLHRDGVSEDTRLVTDINGKPTARLMFLNGMSRLNQNGDIEYLPNSHKINNLAFSLQLYLTAAANYENLMRRIYIRGYRYNLDLADRALLVELGGQTNTVEEARNAMEPLAAILYKVLSGK